MKKVTLRDEMLAELKALGEAEEELEDEIIRKIIELKNLKKLIYETEEEAKAIEEALNKVDKLMETI